MQLFYLLLPQRCRTHMSPVTTKHLILALTLTLTLPPTNPIPCYPYPLGTLMMDANQKWDVHEVLPPNGNPHANPNPNPNPNPNRSYPLTATLTLTLTLTLIGLSP